MSTDGTPRPQDWKELYQLAMLETDPAKLTPLIADANRPILDRIQETLTKPISSEQERLSDALCGLRTLRDEVNCWKSKSSGGGSVLRKSG
jgi:hypothetical protein